MKKYAFGIDVGGTTCKIGFFETNGKLIDKVVEKGAQMWYNNHARALFFERRQSYE